MRRKLLNLATAFSLVLCLTTVGLWARSRYKADKVVFTVGGLLVMADSEEGSFRVQFVLRFPQHESFLWRSRSVDSDENLNDYGPCMSITMGEFSRWHRFGAEGTYGRLRVGFKPDGTVARLAAYPLEARESAGLKYWLIEDAPYWPLVALCLALPMLYLTISLMMKRRFSPNRCRTCSYNLTGNTSGVCPECGTPIGQKASTPI